MRITVELSLYPLTDDYLPRVEAAIGVLKSSDRVQIVVNQMSTQLRGELADVTTAVESLLTAAFADGRPQALVAKFLNADLPIGETPDV